MQYSALQLQAAIMFVLAALPVVALVLARRRVVAPLVAFGAMILLARAVGYALGYVGSEVTPPRLMQVLIEYVRLAPPAVLIVYVCSLQARRYRVARNNDLLRWWFQRAPYVIGAAILFGFVGDLAVQPPLLESMQGIPAAAFLFEFPRIAVPSVYAGLASFVFVGAARVGSGPLGLAARLQNLFWGIALAMLFVLTWHAILWRGIRAFFPQELTTTLVGRLSAAEAVLLLAFAASVLLGIVCYYVQSERGRFMERFLNFLELVSDLAEELANAPVFKGKLRYPYAALRQAAGDEFLNLSALDKRKADNAFLVKVVQKHRAGQRRVNRERLSELSKIYDAELVDPVLAEGLPCSGPLESLPGTLRDLASEGPDKGDSGGARTQGLEESLGLALRTENTSGELEKTPAAAQEWEQLVLVALADAGLLPAGQREDTMAGRGITKKVLDAYDLARHKVQNYGEVL